MVTIWQLTVCLLDDYRLLQCVFLCRRTPARRRERCAGCTVTFEFSLIVIGLSWEKPKKEHRNGLPTGQKQRVCRSLDGIVRCVRSNAEMKMDSSAIQPQKLIKDSCFCLLKMQTNIWMAFPSKLYRW